MHTPEWQKSSYCAQGEVRLHVASTWQKSSHCQEGEACLHVAATAETVHLTESSDPTGVILSAHADAFAALLRALQQNH